jgi:uncharacterized protein YjiK
MFILIISLLSCNNNEKAVDLPYDLMHPDTIIKLPGSLQEISGLDYEAGHLYGVQDEKGKVYVIPLDQDEIRDEKFWDAGDFEGIERVGGFLFIIKSNGNLYKVPVNSIDESMCSKIESPLKAKDNVEGLAFDVNNQRFLIAAKGQVNNQEKEIFVQDFKTLKVDKQPVYIINQATLKKLYIDRGEGKLQQTAQRITLTNYSFNPSAIAVHPVTSDVYILSHPVQQILILSPSWEIKHLEMLPSGLFKQPEGICFDDHGNLFISNEGRSGRANILKFNYRDE